MSGIAGIVHFGGAPIEPGTIERMTSAMAGRGPDGVHHWTKGSAALGQCMLRTTPESMDEVQPLGNEDESLVLVMDGRIDNYEELGRELMGRGARLRTRSDAELALRAYEAWGEDCPDHIIGEFCFFVWDARQRRLFACRDAAGTRHFYYHSSGQWFAFASEIKGLLALERIEARVNETRVLDYLIPEYDREDQVSTFYQDILRMPAGHAMRVSDAGLKAWRYWNPANLPALHFSSMQECAEGFLETLQTAVKCRLRSNGPVGAMLSGGLDSSAIVGVISQSFRSELQEPLKTFSLIREDRENCPDWKSIQAILQQDSWIDPTIIDSSLTGEISLSHLEKIRTTDEPFAFTHGLGYELVYEAARQEGCRVVFDGMAGDLLFYGFSRSMGAGSARDALTRLGGILAAYRRHGVHGAGRDLVRALVAPLAPEMIRGLYRWIRDEREIRRGDFRRLPKERARQYLSNIRSGQEARHRSDSDQARHARHFTSGLLSFAHEVYGQLALSKGMEPRSPLSDRRLIEFAIQMPVEAKIAMPWYKQILRQSMAGILPEEVRLRCDTGGHPGWRFYEELIAKSAQSPDLWNSARLSAVLGATIDTTGIALENAHSEFIDSDEKFELFKLAVLTNWLSTRTIHGVR